MNDKFFMRLSVISTSPHVALIVSTGFIGALTARATMPVGFADLVATELQRQHQQHESQHPDSTDYPKVNQHKAISFYTPDASSLLVSTLLR